MNSKPPVKKYHYTSAQILPDSYLINLGHPFAEALEKIARYAL